jgi:hypothetical protein
MKRFGILVMLMVAAKAILLAPACADVSDFSLASVSASLSTFQAGAHPDFETNFEVTTEPESNPNAFGLKRPYAAARDVVVDLPPGLIGNPNAVPQCTLAQLETFSQPAGGCPNVSQVGVVKIYAYALTKAFTEPLYVMTPPVSGSAVARLGFVAGVVPTYVEADLRSEGDYGVSARVEAASGLLRVVKAETTLWGVPAAKAHDTERQTPLEAFNGASSSPPRPPGGASAPFTINPTRCGMPLEVSFAVDSYALPGQFSKKAVPLGPIIGCDQISFAPALSLTPTNREAAEPTGLDADLTMPQDETVGGVATSALRYATVTLPQGVTIASGAADGLEACSVEQVGLDSREASDCPNAAKIGSAVIDSPALSRPIEGAVYQRTPIKGNLFGIWLVADELGVHLKLPGEVHADPTTGQLTTVFSGTPKTEGLPQAPVREFHLRFKSGPRAPLAAPRACGTYFAEYEFVPWSGNAALKANVPMTFDQGCDTGAFSPKFSAGSASPLAGAFSHFLTTLTAESGEQNVAGLDVTLPPGVSAKLAGVGLCNGAAAETGDCPASSRVGSATVATGPGPSPLWLPQPDKDPIVAYLSGPYKGAPYSLVIKTPAQVGPFDLGVVITRAGIYVDPNTAQATVRSDPLPQILEGVLIVYRTIQVDVDRPEFALNPTNCVPMAVGARVTSIQGAIANPSFRFQVGGCRGLDFKPQLSMRLFGKTNRGAHPRFQATLKAHSGDANIARAQVSLPRSEFLDQAHIRTICTRVQFAADECPPGSIYGYARAFTPLLDQPLEGPVYLRSSDHLLPDLVVALHGQVDVDLAGRIDSVKGGIRTTFEGVPDAPITKFVLTMQGDKKGLLVNSRNLCETSSHSLAEFDGQNGKRTTLQPLLQNSCKKAQGKRARGKMRRR